MLYPELKTMYNKTNVIANKLSTIMDLVTLKIVVPCFIFPKAVISFYQYFSTGYGNSSFNLPFLMWQVFFFSFRKQKIQFNQKLNFLSFINYSKVSIRLEKSNRLFDCGGFTIRRCFKSIKMCSLFLLFRTGRIYVCNFDREGSDTAFKLIER